MGDCFDARTHYKAEREIQEGDVARFWEVFGPDGVYELYEMGNTRGKERAQEFTARLRLAIAEENPKRVGEAVLELIWGVYLQDARENLKNES